MNRRRASAVESAERAELSGDNHKHFKVYVSKLTHLISINEAVGWVCHVSAIGAERVAGREYETEGHRVWVRVIDPSLTDSEYTFVGYGCHICLLCVCRMRICDRLFVSHVLRICVVCLRFEFVPDVRQTGPL